MFRPHSEEALGRGHLRQLMNGVLDRVGRLSWALFVTAFAVRVSSIAVVGEIPGGDTADYDDIAGNLLRGDGFVATENWFGFELRSWRPPLYPVFLATLYGLFGFDHLWVMLAQAILGAGATVLIFRLARKLHPPSALATGIIATLYGPLVQSTNSVMSESMFILLSLLSLNLLVTGGTARAEEARGGLSKGRLALAGICIGFSALTRPVGLLLWPVALALQAVSAAGRDSHAPTWWRQGLWLSAGVLLCLAPWTIRNYAVHHAFVAISTQGGFIVARSNAIEPAWRQERGWGIDRDVFEKIPSEVERDRHWLREGTSFILSNPGAYLRLSLERFLRFFYFMRPGYDFWYMSILPFFALGLYRYGNLEPFRHLSWFMAASLATLCFVLYGSARFRLPFEPVLVLFACAAAHNLWQQYGRAPFLAAVTLVVCTNGLIWWWEDGVRRIVVDCLLWMGLK